MAEQEEHEGGRWDVSTKSKAVLLERFGEDNIRLFDAELAPEEARELAASLSKMADQADASDDTDSDGDDESKDDSDEDDSDEGDDDSDDDSDDDDSDDGDSDDDDSDEDSSD